MPPPGPKSHLRRGRSGAYRYMWTSSVWLIKNYVREFSPPACVATEVKNRNRSPRRYSSYPNRSAWYGSLQFGQRLVVVPRGGLIRRISNPSFSLQTGQ
jgi:hypothetical protein